MKSALLVAVLSARVLAAQAGGTIEGRVTSSTTGAGVGGVEITVRRVNEGVVQHEQTDDRGEFRITQLRDGQYRVSFEKSGFFTPAGSHRDPPVQILGNSSVQVNVELSPWAVIRGRVVKPNGEPASNVVVQTRPFAVSDALTGEDGSFIVGRLPPGSYTLLAKPTALAAGSGGEEEVVATYFRSSVDRMQALEIAVAAGAELSGYEIQLQTTSVKRVSGIILDSTGKPAPQAIIKLFDMSAGVPQMVTGAYLRLPIEESSTKSADDGSFEFPSVRPGNWRVVAESPTWNPVERRDSMASGGEEIIVGEKEIRDLEIRLNTPIPVQALIDTGDSPAPKPMSVPGVMLIPIDGQPDPGGVGAIVRSSAAFELLPGSYHVMPTELARGEYYLAAVLLGGGDVLDQDVKVSAGLPPLHLVYKTDGGSLRGTVESGDGASVMLVRQVSTGMKIVGVAECSARGEYNIPVIPPGDYFAVAFAQPDPGASAPVFLSTVAARGTRVRIGAGTTVDLDLRIIKF